MLTHHEALKKILSVAHILPLENISLEDAFQRVNAEGIIYDMDMPPFHKSAMDGYACARVDLEKELEVVDTVFAGTSFHVEVKPGQCVKIMTGAPVPKGADMVFMQEDAELISETCVRCTNPNSKTNICYQGEDVQKGQVVVSENTILDSRHMPLLAGAGYHTLKVFKQPSCGIITTGTELVEPNEKPGVNQIRNSNASQIQAQLRSMNVPFHYKGILQDNEEELKYKIQEGLVQNDVLILSGGVSVGEYDLVPDILKDLKLKIEVDKTAIQPGKPMVFAHGNGKYVFGLSGNPVASFIQFELYVKPFLWALQGVNFKPLRFQLPLASNFNRRKSVRHMFVPARINEENKIEVIQFHGSAHINALCNADCLMEVPLGVNQINEGEFVFIRPLS